MMPSEAGEIKYLRLMLITSNVRRFNHIYSCSALIKI